MMDTPGDIEFLQMAQQQVNDQTQVRLDHLESQASEAWKVARSWQAYAQQLKEQRDMLRANVEWLQNVTHEAYHQPDIWKDADTPRVPVAMCHQAACQHTQRILRSIPKD